MNNRKLRYLSYSIINYFSNKSCPFCNANNVIEIDRKYFFTRLFECQDCFLSFRHPKDKIDFNKIFYEDKYSEPGLTRNLPDKKTIEDYKKNKFKNTEKDFSRDIILLDILFGKGKIKIIDYGCSWGYASFQFKLAGFDVDSYEISNKIAAIGKDTLGINIKINEEFLDEDCDVFFSSHVIEHHPDIKGMISLAKRKLKKDGYFLAICPNGSEEYRIKHPENFHRHWGLVHPNNISNLFYQKLFYDRPYFISSLPFDLNKLESWDKRSQHIADLSKEELIVIARF